MQVDIYNENDLEVSLEGVYFERFYLDHGIRTTSQLISLRNSNKNEAFEIPLNTTVHFTARDTGGIGIDPSDNLIANAGERILSDWIGFYEGETLGGPVKLQRLLTTEVKRFISKNKRFRYSKLEPGLVGMPMIPYVISYSSIDVSYRYRAALGMGLFRRYNYFNTVCVNVAKQLKDTKRVQFISVDIPSRLLSVTKLNELEAEWVKNRNKPLPLNERLQKYIDNDGRFLIFQLWLWCGENRDLSIFSRIPEEEYERVSLLFWADKTYNLLNLGKLNSWIKRKDNSSGVFDEVKAKKIILRMFMSLQQTNTVGEDVELVDEEVLEEMSGEDTSSKDNKSKSPTRKNLNDPRLEENLHANIDTRGLLDKGLTLDIQKISKEPDTGFETNPTDGKTNDDYNELVGAEVDKDLAQLEILDVQNDIDELEEDRAYVVYKPKAVSHTDAIDAMADDLANKGLLSAAELRRAKTLGRRFEVIDSPYDETLKLNEFSVIDPEELKIGEKNRLIETKLNGVFDESMMHYALKEFDQRYINSVMDRDIVNAVLHAQQAGVAVTDMSLERTDTYLGSYNTLSVQLTPIYGQPTTVKIPYPVINEDGIMRVSGVKYRTKKQRADGPIRKVSPTQVAMTSYISKMFVERTDRVAFDYANWLTREINKASIGDNTTISEIVYSKVFTPDYKLPRSYCAIAKKMSSFKYGKNKLYFDYNRIEQNFPAEVLEKIDRTKYVPIGYTEQDDANLVIVMDADDNLHGIYPALKKIEPLGRLPDFLKLDMSVAPVDFAEVKLYGKKIPVGILLAWQIGLGNLLKTTGVKYRVEKRGTRYDISSHEFAVRFEDEVLIFSRDDNVATLLFNGFNRVKTTINKISRFSLDNQDGYSRILESMDVPLRHTKNYTYLFNSWVDPITRESLIEMNEPTDLVYLFLSAIDKLADDQYKDANGITGTVIRGYERIPGMIHAELSKAIRQYVSAPMSKNSKIEMNPKAVWFAILQDETTAPIEESNPIHAIKEKEVVVFRGAGGRSAQSMTAQHRQFGEDSIGVISEANVDNGAVGTITYLTADPNIKSLRGKPEPLTDLTNVERTKLQSTSMLISPGSDTDD